MRLPKIPSKETGSQQSRNQLSCDVKLAIVCRVNSGFATSTGIVGMKNPKTTAEIKPKIVSTKKVYPVIEAADFKSHPPPLSQANFTITGIINQTAMNNP